MLPPPSEDDRYAELERRIRQLETALRSAFTTISGGAGIRIVDGGRLALVAADGTEIFYIGPVLPDQADGSPQPGWIVRRADGSTVLLMRDAFPTDDEGQLNQALNWYDRAGNVVFADDTNSGQGVARPWLSGGFARSRYGDMSVYTSATTFETLWEARITKQQPRLAVRYRGTTDTAGSTGEVRLMVNGTQVGSTVAHSFAQLTTIIGPAAVAGEHMSTGTVELQARMTGGPGAIRVEALGWEGRQS